MPLPPAELLDLQIEFAHQIAQPVYHIQAQDRLSIYQKMYWSRLFRYFHVNYPFLVRLLGSQEMNEKVVTPYMSAHRPKHWSLETIGDLFLSWLNENYQEKDKAFIEEAAQLDTLCIHLRGRTTLSLPQACLSERLSLQPYVELCIFDYQMPQLREQFLEHSVTFWEENPFPKITRGGPYYYVLYRAKDFCVHYRQITWDEFQLLNAIKMGKSLEEIIQLGAALSELPLWVYDWAQLGLLTRSLS